MKLNYRGASYESNPNIETISSDISAKFRGIAYQIYPPVKPFFSQSEAILKFRGAAYSKTQV
jgi:hypothetical protein